MAQRGTGQLPVAGQPPGFTIAISLDPAAGGFAPARAPHARGPVHDTVAADPSTRLSADSDCAAALGSRHACCWAAREPSNRTAYVAFDAPRLDQTIEIHLSIHVSRAVDPSCE